MQQQSAPVDPGVLEGLVVDAARVVVIDDEPGNVAVLDRVLRSVGITDVHGVSDPCLAVEVCTSLRPDLVMLDLHMPRLDGVAVLRALRAALPADELLPVLVLTADVRADARDDALAAGADDVVTKPFDVAEVVLRTRNLLRTRWLYRQLQARTVELQVQLDAHLAAERRAAARRARQLARVDAVLRRGGPGVALQPISDLRTGEVVGVEALARFSESPPATPDGWFRQADAVGRGAELELAAVAAALRHVDGLPPGVFMSVNVAPPVAATPAFCEAVAAAPPHRLVVEITEHHRVDDPAGLAAALAPLRAAGVRIAVDDAGSGYAGLQQILRLRPDVLKLDMGLTRGVDADPARRALVTAMGAFAAEIGAVLIAEGIETAAEAAALRALGVPWGQGYHLAPPGPPMGPRVPAADGG